MRTVIVIHVKGWLFEGFLQVNKKEVETSIENRTKNTDPQYKTKMRAASRDISPSSQPAGLLSGSQTFCATFWCWIFAQDAPSPGNISLLSVKSATPSSKLTARGEPSWNTLLKQTKPDPISSQMTPFHTTPFSWWHFLQLVITHLALWFPACLPRRTSCLFSIHHCTGSTMVKQILHVKENTIQRVEVML